MTPEQMVECPKCGVFNDVTRRDKCWKCQTTLAKLPLPPAEKTC